LDPAQIPLDDPALQALVRANRRALQTIAEQPRLAINYVASFLGRLTSEEARQYYERYIGPYFISDGRVDLNVAQHAVDAVASELGIPAATVAWQATGGCVSIESQQQAIANFGDPRDIARQYMTASLLTEVRRVGLVARFNQIEG
jgi:hypothetical protein